MDRIEWNDVERLIGPQDGHCISVYLPAHRGGPGSNQEPILFKKLVRAAKKELSALAPEAAVEASMRPLEKLLDAKAFWGLGSDGIAVFGSATSLRTFRLPLTMPERVCVGDRFHIRPLLPLLTEDGRFYVLVLSENRVKLYQASRQSMQPMEVAGMPTSLADALKYNDIQTSNLYRPTHSSGGQRAAPYAGHGAAIEERQANLHRELSQVAHALRPVTQREGLPMVVAAVEHVAAAFHEISGYVHLVSQGVPGNPDRIKDGELHQRAWAAMADRFREPQRQALARFHELAGTGRTATDLAEVIHAARGGRIETLLLAEGAERWGRFEPQTGAVTVHGERLPADEDLLDRAAVETVRERGRIAVVSHADLPPESGAVAAIFRY